jgi:hypothetical protein
MNKQSQAQVREESLRLYDMLVSDDATLHKKAAMDLTDYTREGNREGSFASKIIEPTPFDKDRLQMDMHTDQPMMLFEFEPSSPFAYTVDYGTTPANFVPRGRRYPLVFGREQTQEVSIDLLELQTYKYDMRRILGDNMTKDLIARRDSRLLTAVHDILGPAGTVLPWVGKAMHVDSESALTHSSWAHSKNVMRDTLFSIEPTKVLQSHLRIANWESFIHEDLKGVSAIENIMKDGFTMDHYAGLDLMFTIKKNLVSYADSYYFGPQDFLGRYVHWHEPTMSLEKKDTEIKFYLYEIYGITLAHPGALSIIKYR